MIEPLTSLGAAEIARQIRTGQITPLETVEAHIAQIEQVNPKINALVTPTFEQARRDARHASELLAKKPDRLPPLFGVPVTIKDALPVAGVRFTAGSIHYKEHVAREDAEGVRQLKEAGAIILGKTNCADMSGSTETNNLVFGLTRNPWNLAHSAGGSSGGEAALIASRGSPLGLGSDIAGSIRIPAAFCGIVGLKPSAGRITTDGHFPPTPDLISGWNTVGREIGAAVHNAAEALAGCGLQIIKDIKLPLMKVSIEYAAIMYRAWLPQYRLLLGNGKPASLVPETIANWKGKGRVSPSTLAILANIGLAGAAVCSLGYGHMEQLEQLRRQIIQLMGPHGLLLWPVFPSTSPKHGFAWSLNSTPTYTSIFNGLGFPSVVIPVGLSKENLPLTVQIIASPGNDETALAVAAVLERELGGCQFPPIGSQADL